MLLLLNYSSCWPFVLRFKFLLKSPSGRLMGSCTSSDRSSLSETLSVGVDLSVLDDQSYTVSKFLPFLKFWFTIVCLPFLVVFYYNWWNLLLSLSLTFYALAVRTVVVVKVVPTDDTRLFLFGLFLLFFSFLGFCTSV